MSKNSRICNAGGTRSNRVKLVKKRFLLISSIFLIVSVFVVIYGSYVNTSKRGDAVQSSMKEYLQNKYGKAFEVERPTLSNGGLGVSGTWGAEAYPVGSTENRFSVMKSENRGSFADQHTALIWSQRETRRINELFQNSAKEWKVNASVDIYLDQPLSETALPESPMLEDIIKEESGPSYTVNLHYSEIKPDSIDLIVADMERVTNHIKTEGIRNVNYNYSVVVKNGSENTCSVGYNKQFDYSHTGIKNCLSRAKER